mmetsp:Transcript_65069/g.212090  ORF Transcript_65069/g.212090 Transcript_65069/m.212090 type:complete len:119 (-) Transcript_65069:749-1105(-)
MLTSCSGLGKVGAARIRPQEAPVGNAPSHTKVAHICDMFVVSIGVKPLDVKQVWAKDLCIGRPSRSPFRPEARARFASDWDSNSAVCYEAALAGAAKTRPPTDARVAIAQVVCARSRG